MKSLKICKEDKGFLLIEVIVYLSLFSIILVSSLYSFFSFMETNNKSGQENLIIEEGEFLLKKIENFVSLANEIEKPSESETVSSKLILIMNNFEDRVIFKEEESDLVLEKNNEEFTLNTNLLPVTNLQFEYLAFGENSHANALKVSFTLAEEEFETIQIKMKHE